MKRKEKNKICFICSDKNLKTKKRRIKCCEKKILKKEKGSWNI